ncbi:MULTISPECIES: succinylglutamate desuccinylase/aspartoacylase family protein [Burkholderia]|uniref:Succinylglutamate desuccinylase n=1 Tax=Burkholderia contaminans TaxID=488447 RepID=A0A2S5DPJ9_9BURK|nr:MULTISPECIES: succinylglutamate desuccinylase/aspartoacylase family protein [Burkholderia]EKS9793915.1 succinylglutamate desuccinylase/aspartoacylase family protein [Burkholderia cepacia]EKS9803446.1 succinylglutamate desuccinylase/aspartoacylase family protein [Burkholderia cepacia]EKS9811578.1 succinylglutamate desuccinylase/aspartoacylase family protein [Burkholderia cepacia]EKS9819397.1 succinylglutamate desuccinylase/aspartoacylase family protein [Burkholderia cepacia]EKS9826010.1 succ
MEIMDLPLPDLSPGTRMTLREYTFGPKDAEHSVYFQAALHAGEVPGLLVIQHLLARLESLEFDRALAGRVTVMTWANPVGMQQFVGGTLTGRFDWAGSGNFDRRFPDIGSEVVRQFTGGSYPTNRDDAKYRLMEMARPAEQGSDPVAYLKTILLWRAFAHDMVLDLHCDKTAVMHVYGNWAHEQRAVSLSRCLNAPVLLLEDSAGGSTFDQSFHDAWSALRRCGLQCGSRQGFAAVVELRGQRDVSDTLAACDAGALIDFLRIEGFVVDGRPPAHREPPVISALEAVDHLKATRTGIVTWSAPVGSFVARGAEIGAITALTNGQAESRTVVRASIDGILVARMHVHFVLAGQRIAMIAGQDQVPGRISGALLPD